MNNHKYYNFKNRVNSYPKLLTMEEIKGMKINPKDEQYISIFRYNDEHKNIYPTYGKDKDGKIVPSVKGTPFHDVVTDVLVWDFDNEHNPENARLDTIELAHRLNNDLNIDPDDMHVSFSGNKGFHLEVKLDRDITQEQFKKITGGIVKGLKTYDPSVCDPPRLLRMERTTNLKTGLYKIPLHVEDLAGMSIDHIKELASTPRLDFVLKADPVSLPEEMLRIEPKKEKIKKLDNTKFDPKSAPKGWKVYKWALAEGFFEPGERQNALMVIAATARALNFSKEKAYYFCKDALEKRAARTGHDDYNKDEVWNNIIGSVYSDTWEGGAYSPQSNPWLASYCERMGFTVEREHEDDKVYQMHDIEAEFIDYVKNIDDNTILTGITELDRDLPLTVGMNLGIIGAASSGKTALALKILENTSNAGVVSVFASLDMRRNRLYEKLLYRLSGLSRGELYKRIQEDGAGDIFQKVREEYKNVFFYDRSCPSVDDIRRYIGNIEQSSGKKVKLVMVDYFERIGADRSDETAASKEVAGKLQDLVNDLNVCLITLVQPNKFSLAGGPDTPILNYTAIKGSSYLYQAFRSIISIWRPFFTPELKDKDKFLQMAILKNDLGELNTFEFEWEGKRGEIKSISEEAREQLNEWMQEKMNKKNAAEGKESWQ